MTTGDSQKLRAGDWVFILVCAALTAISILLTIRYFSRAFPEATIEFRFDREASRGVAERLLTAQRLTTAGMKHTAVFDADDLAKVFLERSLGLEKANAVMRRDVRVWFWHHRWFRPLQEEEFSVDVAPDGRIVSFAHTIPEDRALPETAIEAARGTAEAFLRTAGIATADLRLVAQSERKLPRRAQRIFTWESKSIHPAGAPYRHVVHVDGDRVTSYAQRLRVPEGWQRAYRDLRSKNFLAGSIDAVFLAITVLAALVVFVVRLRRGDVHQRFLFAIGIISVVLVAGVSLNSFPLAEAGYETTTSYAAFLAQMLFGSIIQAIGTAILLMIVCGAGEVLYRERLPSQLAIPRLWTMRALTSKRVFKSFILAYTLVAFFFAYQTVFYVVAARFGAWAPAEIPYDDMLNTALPWFAVLFAGFFPSFSEEFLSRAFSIPFLQRILRGRFPAIVLAGMIWGFGHATYPNQPFYIRGLEVGFAGILLGYLMDAFGLLPLLIWHFTVDAFYTSLLLFRSQNPYYIASAALASFVFAVPLLAQIVLYVRNRGFLPDEELTNASLPLAPPPEPPPPRPAPPLPEPIRARPRAMAIAVVAVAAAALAIAYRPPEPSDALDYRITRKEAKTIAVAHVRSVTRREPPPRVAATPSGGFRSWNRDSRREDGGSPGSFDAIAASYIVRHANIETLIDAFRTRVFGGTWSVRLFTPMQKEEFFVEIDPRTPRVIGYHRYQEETRPGATLERDAALGIATAAFASYGADARRFELKEALAFQQPARRDWLFHFDEGDPIAAEAVRRVTVRVAGNEVTQFTNTIRIPEVVHREETTQTLTSVALTLLKIGGILAVLSLVVTGFVVAAFRHRIAWRRAALWTLALSVIPIAGELVSLESEMFQYNTSIQWQTFVASLSLQVIRDIALRLGLLFLVIAGVDAAYPHALSLVTTEGRRRFGASAASAALTAVAILVVSQVGLSWLGALVPSSAMIEPLDVTHAVAIPLPALLATGNAIYSAVVASAAAGLLLFALRRPAKRPWIADAAAIATLVCISIEPDASARQMALMLAGAFVTAITVWLVARFVLGGNALAWPLAVFLVTMIESAASMLHHGRSDLQANGVALIVLTIAVVTWISLSRGGPSPPDVTFTASGKSDDRQESPA